MREELARFIVMNLKCTHDYELSVEEAMTMHFAERGDIYELYTLTKGTTKIDVKVYTSTMAYVVKTYITELNDVPA